MIVVNKPNTISPELPGDSRVGGNNMVYDSRQRGSRKSLHSSVRYRTAHLLQSPTSRRYNVQHRKGQVQNRGRRIWSSLVRDIHHIADPFTMADRWNCTVFNGSCAGVPAILYYPIHSKHMVQSHRVHSDRCRSRNVSTGRYIHESKKVSDVPERRAIRLATPTPHFHSRAGIRTVSPESFLSDSGRDVYLRLHSAICTLPICGSDLDGIIVPKDQGDQPGILHACHIPHHSSSDKVQMDYGVTCP